MIIILYDILNDLSYLTSPPRITAANIRIYLIFLETRIIGLHSAADRMGLSSLKFLWWDGGLRKTFYFYLFRPFKVIRGHYDIRYNTIMRI